jgi:tetratricopeptide (TPR) repeat protein
MPAPDLSVASEPSMSEKIRRGFADRAARELDGVLHSDSRSAEARLRAACALIAVRNDTAAARLLEPLETASRLDARTTYLAALFLGGIRARAGKADIAAALFERAIAAMPSGQSAYVALADIERARGNAGAAAAVIERMFGAPSTPRDPWAEFALGPYWLAQPLLQDLRGEVRR